MYKHRQYLKYTEYNKIPNLIGEVYDRQVYNPLEDYSGYYLGAEISGKHHDRFEDIQDHVNFGGFVYDIYTKEPITYEKEYYTLYWRIQPARPKNANGGNNGGNAWNSTLIDSDNPTVVEIPAERQIGVGLYNGEDGTAETAQIVVTDLSNNAVISQSGTFTPPAIDVGKTYKIVAQLTDGSTKETTAEVVESSEQNGTKYNVTIPSKGTVKNAVVITVIPSSAKENITGIKWHKGSTEIEGATGESYTPKEEDVNSEIKAVVTFQESGSDRCCNRHRRASSCDALEGQHHRRYFKGIPRLQRRGKTYRSQSSNRIKGCTREGTACSGRWTGSILCRMPQGTGCRHQRLLAEGPLREVRLHDRRRYSDHAVRRQVSDDPCPVHGAEDLRGERSIRYLLHHGVGIRSVHFREEPISRRIPGSR